ncbi:hypothetical protein ACQEUU_37205 [Nonomuraea sp. CA-218870]|uniref:hypothetical protein n=1 Tax=Nonomuraea sp. CA-218870 TaxID=3239998 RepID=UPI003D8B88A4
MSEPMTPEEFASWQDDMRSCRGPSEEEIRADERRKVAEEIAAALEEKAAKVRDEALAFSEVRGISETLLTRSGALTNAAVIAREIGEARDPR